MPAWLSRLEGAQEKTSRSGDKLKAKKVGLSSPNSVPTDTACLECEVASFTDFSRGQAKLSGPGRSVTRARHQSVWAVRLSLLAQQEGGGKQGVALASAGPGHRRRRGRGVHGSIPGARRAGRGRPASILSGGGDELAAGAAPRAHAARAAAAAPRAGLPGIPAGAMDRGRGKWHHGGGREGRPGRSESGEELR